MNLTQRLYNLLHRFADPQSDAPELTPPSDSTPNEPTATTPPPAPSYEPIRPTTTHPCEDPSPTEPLHSINRQAYDTDLRSFR